ncbi:MAG: hypothetical protein R2799_12590 [Crocinitomicaceae bacterium]
MDTVATVIVWLYGLGIAAALVLLIYLIFKRIKDKKSENFEVREN